MAHTACLVCLVSTVSGRRKNPLEEQVLVVGTKQNLSHLLFLDIYEPDQQSSKQSGKRTYFIEEEGKVFPGISY